MSLSDDACLPKEITTFRMAGVRDVTMWLIVRLYLLYRLIVEMLLQGKPHLRMSFLGDFRHILRFSP